MSAVAAAVGRHILADLHGVESGVLRDGTALEHLLCDAARNAGARVLSCHFHSFGDGGGVTGVALLSESHISIHTWPEHGFAAADIFMCGASHAERALQILIEALAPADSHVESITRGAAGTEKINSNRS